MNVVWKILKILIILALVVGALGYGYYRFFIFEPPLISDEDRAQITLMPLPAKLELTGVDIPLNEGITPIFTEINTSLAQQAVERFSSATKLEITSDGLPLNISLGSDDESIGFDMQESYMLKVKPSGIYIEADHSVGVIRALETVRQLIKENNNEMALPAIEVDDHPRFPWRGVMVDVSRHFVPKVVILRILESMSAVKMNVFHWHLSDDQGFRVESKSFPLLHETGSNGLYYTQEEIREVLEFARVRGIRVIPEFDVPGHSQSWQIAYPVLASIDTVPGFGEGPTFTAPMDPTREEVYQFLDVFIEEMSDLFPDDYFHIGGDEVNPSAWEENVKIQAFMKDRGIDDHHGLQAYFNERIQQILKKHGKRMLGWDEILTPALDTGVVVQSWTSHRALFEAVQQGGTAILSAGYYLDHILPAGKHYSVDPLVLEGAINIEPDTGHWKMFDQVMMVGENSMESQVVIFDRDPENVSGFFAMLSDRIPFEGGVIENGVLTCKMDGPAGEMTYTANIAGDSLEGSISLALLSFTARGHRTGGADMPGTSMPVIEVMKPLTVEEKDRIIGGEACQWAEFVDGDNIESRIWPRAAAIAEKLWSPPQLTQDVDDMYRRLETTSVRLSDLGSLHDRQYHTKLADLIDPAGLPGLQVLTEYLEEVKYHGRMPDLLSGEPVYLPDFQLNRVVDAVRPESLEARKFNLAVERFVQYENEKEKENEKENEDQGKEDREYIIQTLQKLAGNDATLRPYINENGMLADLDSISSELSYAASELHKVLTAESSIDTTLLKRVQFLENGEHGVIVAIAPGLNNLIQLQF